MDADLAFKSLIKILHSDWAFSKIKDSINICLTLGSDIISFTLEINLYKRKSVKASFGPSVILVEDWDLFPDSSCFSQAFRTSR